MPMRGGIARRKAVESTSAMPDGSALHGTCISDHGAPLIDDGDVSALRGAPGLDQLQNHPGALLKQSRDLYGHYGIGGHDGSSAICSQLRP